MKTTRNSSAATTASITTAVRAAATKVRKSKIAIYWESKPNEGVIHNMRAVLK